MSILLKNINRKELEKLKNNKFPVLFIKKCGKIRMWACWVIGDTVYRIDGFIDGKIKSPSSHKYNGNTLRNSEQQAILEAEKIWLKQIDKDYCPAEDDIEGNKIYEYVKQQKSENGGMNRGVKMFNKTEIKVETTAGKKDLSIKHRPMLAKKYKDWKNEDEFILTNPGKDIIFPAIIQAKLDGIRSISFIKNDKIILESRNSNNFVHLNHIREEINYWLKHKNMENIILDGELYVHKIFRDENNDPTYDETLQEMTGVERYQFISEACKITRKQPHDYEEMIEYWIFDIWDTNLSNIDRYNKLLDLFKDYDGSILKLVPTKIVNNHEEIEDFMKLVVGETNNRQGYEFEGTMIRQSNAKYISSTTHQSCLLKYKRFQDDEWKIIGAEECIGGNQNGSIKWICEKKINNSKKKVIAKQMGDTSISKNLYQLYKKNPENYIGKMINIRYNDISKDGVPRFPRATAFVEDK
jgi:ATP-dependent DNA ligase